jgi:hypothetical protein
MSLSLPTCSERLASEAARTVDEMESSAVDAVLLYI